MRDLSDNYIRNKDLQMSIQSILKKLNDNNHMVLSENDAKQILAAYGVPVVPEVVVADTRDVCPAAEKIGFPLVLKGLGVKLLHKTESALVHLNLTDTNAVHQAALAIAAKAGGDLEGYLLQPQIPGQREFVAGMFMDPQFGPVIMFGIGGILTEALSDVSFRLAPLDESDITDMLSEIKAHKLLNSFRGEDAVDRAQLVKTLKGLSRLSIDHPEITEIDINPLVVSPDGNIRAVDALIIKDEKPSTNRVQPSVPPDAIGSLFYPKSMAFVGASAQIGKWGHTLAVNTISGEYEGGIYLVNPRGGKFFGRTVYRYVAEIPAEIDLAVVTIPAAKVIDLIPQFQEKGIRNMLLITSGFAETGTAGKQMEIELVEKAQQAGILILGPNTMGICNPHKNIYCTGSPVMPRPGSTAMIAQSGNMGVQLLAFAEQQGIGIRAFCGSGNEAMMTIEDFLDGLEVDDLTRTVMLYVESVKNGRRFFESSRRVGKKKPIVLLKGGRSKAGNRAAASHTGAMTSDTKVFEAVCRQAGIVKVEQPMELLDLSASFSSLPLPRGNRAAIMTLGGGWGVVTSDLCSQFGLEVPELSPDLIGHFDQLLPEFWSRSNPIDLVGENDPAVPITVLEELLKWDGCDAVINLGIVGRRILIERFSESVIKSDPNYSAEFMKGVNSELTKFERNYIHRTVKLMEKYEKPVYGVSLLPDKRNQTVYRVKNSRYKGVFYPTPERAVKAFAKMHEYQCFLNRNC